MNRSWIMYFLWCFSYDIFIGTAAADGEGLKLSTPTILVSTELTTIPKSSSDMPSKKKNSLVDLKSSSILRDANTHSNVDVSKSSLSELLKNIQPTDEQSMTTNYDISYRGVLNQPQEGIPSLPNENDSTVTFGFPDTTDLLPPLNSNINAEVSIKNIVTNETAHANYSSPIEIPALLPDNSTLYQIVKSTSQFATSYTTPLPSTLFKNSKDKENKNKGDTNSKLIKKMSKTKTTTGSGFNTNTEPTVRFTNAINSSRVISNESNVTFKNTPFSTFNRNFSEGVNANDTNILPTSSLRTSDNSDNWQPFDIALVAIALIAIVSTVTAIGIFSVMIYRRYQWNKPQAFSDKCSNADSTGYIDDSTWKENSEEMYSLDNDSFLNSLEAMTIQNYWADSIRHTKL